MKVNGVRVWSEAPDVACIIALMNLDCGLESYFKEKLENCAVSPRCEEPGFGCYQSSEKCYSLCSDLYWMCNPKTSV